MTKKDNGSVVHRTAEALRQLAYKCGDDGLLGSEDDLLEQLCVSRPTLRQAAALVAQEQLIYVRRGVRGGYFASVPESSAVTRMASIFLRSRGATMTELINAVGPVRVELARLATRNRDPEKQMELRKFLEHEQSLKPAEVDDYKAFLKAERHFGALISELGGSNVFSLFLNILYDLVAQVSHGVDVYANHADRIEQYQRQRNLMAAAILDGDEELAVLATQRCSSIVMDWMLQDLERHEQAFSLAENPPAGVELKAVGRRRSRISR
ncbi:FadR/GntR family transcriptional regulator [Novosphingobium pentaromativorans]|uniref:GntR C-terminal domain-containing protein n=1 Tax=Novosphingobium pentaromativorans US6-1 TaxID=1088721 RepID=G6E862_9SPHN|nr:FCD domain-containing protein [Novosphingobium pentaromativorans]AIT81438.1 hypothetical protein JI59_17440 [Novosphingobium pentaromativorans US6-1]EHJ62402.1 hypothetical protein NSU_0533 [Novosphingobium pentaromativorans US6-1]